MWKEEKKDTNKRLRAGDFWVGRLGRVRGRQAALGPLSFL